MIDTYKNHHILTCLFPVLIRPSRGVTGSVSERHGVPEDHGVVQLHLQPMWR